MNVNDIKILFEKNADAEHAKYMEAYMRDQFEYYGIPTSKRRELTKKILAADDKSNSIDWGFVFDLYKEPKRECQYFVHDYLKHHAGQLTKADIPNLKKCIETKSWWDTVDGLDRIVGDIALLDKSVNDILLAWSIDKNFWLRRIAIDHQLSRKENTDTKLLATIIENNFGQTEFFINKAIGWSLREYSKTNPDWVRKFITDNKDKMANLSIREASKYI